MFFCSPSFFKSLCLAVVVMALCVAQSAHAQTPQTPPASPPRFARQQVIMGWVEYVMLDAIGAKMKAKLDTGATTSSLRAEVVKIVKGKKKGDKRRVIFQVEDSDGKISTLERTLVRWVRIKSRSGAGYHRRPVVNMNFCVAGRRVRAEVNLAPRADFIYPVLVGRNMLREGHIIVDATTTFTARPFCPPLDLNTDQKEE
jgi:hypothetical protein